MALKTSIYLNDANEQFLGFFKSPEGELQASSQIGYFLAGYRRLIKLAIADALPKLGETEWQYILQAYNGHAFSEYDHAAGFRIASLVADDLGIENLFDIKDLEVKSMLEKIAGLTRFEEMAVVEIARMFWARAYVAKEDDTFSDVLKGLVELL